MQLPQSRSLHRKRLPVLAQRLRVVPGFRPIVAEQRKIGRGVLVSFAVSRVRRGQRFFVEWPRGRKVAGHQISRRRIGKRAGKLLPAVAGAQHDERAHVQLSGAIVGAHLGERHAQAIARDRDFHVIVAERGLQDRHRPLGRLITSVQKTQGEISLRQPFQRRRKLKALAAERGLGDGERALGGVPSLS